MLFITKLWGNQILMPSRIYKYFTLVYECSFNRK